MYHKVTPVRPNSIAVSPESFEAQQRFLAVHYQVVALSDVRRWFLGEAPLPRRAVLLTFDDGYRNNLEFAHPVLSELGHAATIFVPTDFVGSSMPLPHDARLPVPNPTLTWDELAALQDVFEIGSHACSHRVLTQLPLDQAKREIEESKRLLERRLGRPVYAFSYPKGSIGDFSPALEAAVRDAGYDLAFTTIPAVNRAGANPLRIARHNVEDYGLRYFAGLLDGSAELLRLKDTRLGYQAKSALNRMRNRTA